jgi:drug/metabolite transporter (DMT)-like permease
LALLALTLIGTRRKSATAEAENQTGDSQSRTWVIPAVLVTFFLLAGCSRLIQRTLKHVSTDDQLPTFLFAAFVVASVPSIILLIKRQKRISKTELGLGVAMGASNILQSHFILKALTLYEGYIVFPISSAGGLILTTFVATRMLGEKITSRTLIGIAIAVIALVLLNWLPSS